MSLTVMHFEDSEHLDIFMLHNYTVEPEGFLVLEGFQEKINNNLPAHELIPQIMVYMF